MRFSATTAGLFVQKEKKSMAIQWSKLLRCHPPVLVTVYYLSKPEGYIYAQMSVVLQLTA